MNPKLTANYLNNYFANVSINIANQINPPTDEDSNLDYFLKEKNPHSFQLLPTNSLEIKYIIISLKIKNSSGYDEINQKLIIKCVDFITEILSDIINSSFYTGIVPNEIKIAKVIPI